MVAGLATGQKKRCARAGPAGGAEPLSLFGQRRKRQAAADPVPLQRPGRPPLSPGLFRRHRPKLAGAALSALLYSYGSQCGLYLVEPRHRRPPPGRAQRRAIPALAATGGIQPHSAAALHFQRPNGQGALALSAGCVRRCQGLAAPAPSAHSLPLHNGRSHPPGGTGPV